MTDIISYIANLTKAKIGQLSTANDLVVQKAPSTSGETYFNGSSSDNVSLLFLAKNKSQTVALNTLCDICNLLTRKQHTNGIYNLTVATHPNYVGKEGDFWIYSCIINFKFHNKEAF